MLKIHSIDIFELMKNLLAKPFVKKSLIAFGIIVAFILVMNYIVMPLYVSSPETIVPKVIGLDEADAIQILKDEDFKPVVTDTSYGVSLPPGKIFLQKPDGGKVVKKGRTIFLFISGGVQTVAVPLLKGKSVLDARFALERIGLKLGDVDEAVSDQPKDMIFDQQFEQGTMLKKGQSVGVSVSIGKGFGDIEVPDLIGKSLSEARDILTKSSLTVGKINYQISNTLLPNTILDQYPAPGNKLNSGEGVDLFVTKQSTVEEKRNITE